MTNKVLSPAESGKLIAEKSQYVHINLDGIEKLSDELLANVSAGKLQLPAYGDNDIHPNKDNPLAVDWIFLTDVLNFCFWTPGDATKWKVNGHTGYYAFAAAVGRALKEGVDFTNPAYYSKITESEMDRLMRSDDGVTKIPLLAARVRALHEAGAVLLSKYNGTFKECVKQANKSAKTLLEIIVSNFESFKDESVFDKKRVSFYKRAQILIGDLWSCFEGESWGEFTDIEDITMFADYRVPQVLVHFDALSYMPKLMELLKKDVVLESGSREEIEIRGCSIEAVELLKDKVRAKLLLDPNNKVNLKFINAVIIDYYLWCYRREHAEMLEHIPFHKVIGIYY